MSLQEEMTKQTLAKLEAYGKSEAINQSYLKDVLFSREPQEDEDTPAYTQTGSYLDCCLTTPEIVSSLYYVIAADIPDPAVKTVLDDLYEHSGHLIEKFPKEIGDSDPIVNLIVESKIRSGVLNNYKKPASIVKAVAAGVEYYNSLARSKGRKIISKEYQDEVRSILMHVNTKEPTAYSLRSNDPNVEIRKQEAIFFEYRGFDCKALLDFLFVNHEEGWYQVKDFKYTEVPLKDYLYRTRHFRMDFQLSFYNLAASILLPDDYTPILPQLLVYSSADRKGQVYNFTEADLHTGRYGLIRKTEKRIGANKALGMQWETSFKEPGFEDGFDRIIAANSYGVPPTSNIEYKATGGVSSFNLWEFDGQIQRND